jgi:hypothetical protein
MSPISRPKKDKKKLSLVDVFGIPQLSNQPCDSENEVYDHPLSVLLMFYLYFFLVWKNLFDILQVAYVNVKVIFCRQLCEC